MTKQGRADIKGPADQKVEPNPRAISPGAVSYLGNAKGNHTKDGTIANPNFPNMNLGNGYRAPSPSPGRVVRPCGTQGKH